MWPFKKKKEVKEERQLEKCKFKVSFTKKLIPIGKTLVELTMEDGRMFNTIVYGEFKQWIFQGTDEYVSGIYHNLVKESSVIDYIDDSLVIAKGMLKQINGNTVGNFENDKENFNEVILGKVIAARIVKTEEYEKMFDVAYLEENK